MAREKPDYELPWLVPHPRHGDRPTRARHAVTHEEVLTAYASYEGVREVRGGFRRVPPGRMQRALARLGLRARAGIVFLDSAIPADLARQSECVVPRACYADLLHRCRDCGEGFLFFAAEQRHWYEVLRFNLSATCVRCSGCRAADQRVRRAAKRYAERSGSAAELDARALAQLLRDALLLAENGLLKRRSTLQRLRNVARRRGVAGDECAAVDAFVASMKAPLESG